MKKGQTKKNMDITLYKGSMLHALSETECEVFEEGALLVDEKGKILEVGAASRVQANSAHVVDFGNRLVVPGFVDTHVHLPQYVFAGLGARELLEWLQTYTFPMEARFSNPDFAREAARIFFADLARAGTTSSAVYATSHTGATRIAFEEAEKAGGRACIGMVLMERNGEAPLHRSWDNVSRDCEELAEEWSGEHPKLQFAITPRFAITCGEKMLKGAAQIARERNLLVQTHLSENAGEISFTLDLFKGAKDYTEVYERAGILTSRTLLAHGIHLSAGERERIRAAGSTIVHCATSNRYLQSGVFAYRQTRNAGVAVSLGSDVAGGYELSMLHEMREALEASKTWNILNRQSAEPVLSVGEVFYAATLGGARALGMDSRVGSFAAGKCADFVVLDDTSVNRFAYTGFYQSPVERLSRLIYRGDSQSVLATYVDGKKIAGV
jgi:guanine deaminase